MRRNPSALGSREFDVVVVGGGIAGACVAWDATLRGLSVAIVEQGDFGGGASANSLKIVHGGIRYLQHLDLPRLRASVAERSVLLRIAPHLVEPLPFVIPTYRNVLSGKPVLAAGLRLYDLLSVDRNRRIDDPARRIPRSRLLSRDETLGLLPEIQPDGVSGAAVFHDGLIYNPPRLTLGFVRAAADRGACVANYVEATGLLRDGDRVRGVKARDRVTEEAFEVRGRIVVNAAGGWAPGLLSDEGLLPEPGPTFSRDACFIVDRPLAGRHAIALLTRARDPDAIATRGARHLFLVPWRDSTLIGVWHTIHTSSPDGCRIDERELQAFLAEVNGLGLRFELSREQVRQTCGGLVLFGRNRPDAAELRYGKRSLIIDHARRQGVRGLITAITVRYTVGRRLAERVVDRIVRTLGARASGCRTSEVPLPGGNVRIDELARDIADSAPAGLSPHAGEALLRNHGGEWRRALEPAERSPRLLRTIGGSRVTGAEILHAVRREMAVTLADVVLRRTELGSAGHPGPRALTLTAELVAEELGWSADRTRREIEAVEAAYPAPAG